MRSRSEQRGMTLVELMVTVAVLALVATAAAQVSIGFQQQYAAENLKRQSADAARTALLWIERDLRLAGYGMDPSLAFDFNIFSRTTSAGATRCATVGDSAPQNPTCVRDHSVDGQPDELVFYARDPIYWGADLATNPEGRAWPVLAGSNSDVTLGNVSPLTVFPENQILQLVCPGAAQVLYASVAATRPPGTAVIPTKNADAKDPFQQAPSGLSCVNAGGGRAFLVNRYRYAIENLFLGDNTTQIPTLVLDTGTDRNLDGIIDTRDVIRVSVGVLDLQVAYVRLNPPPAGSLPLTPGTPARVGGTPTVPLAFCNTGVGLTPQWPLNQWIPCNNGLIVQRFGVTAATNANKYPTFTGFGFVDMPLLDEARQSPTFASISEIQVAAVGRSLPRWKAPGTPLFVGNLPALMNRPAGGPQQFEMHVADIAVPIRNTRTRALSFY